jgi:hypothetical protein
MYFTDAGIEELDDRRGSEEVTIAWLAERLRAFVDLNPEHETAVDRLASWLARLDADAESDGEIDNPLYPERFIPLPASCPLARGTDAGRFRSSKRDTS